MQRLFRAHRERRVHGPQLQYASLHSQMRCQPRALPAPPPAPSLVSCTRKGISAHIRMNTADEGSALRWVCDVELVRLERTVCALQDAVDHTLEAMTGAAAQNKMLPPRSSPPLHRDTLTPWRGAAEQAADVDMGEGKDRKTLRTPGLLHGRSAEFADSPIGVDFGQGQGYHRLSVGASNDSSNASSFPPSPADARAPAAARVSLM